MFKLRYAIQIDKKRSADLDNGVVARQQTNKIGKPLGDRDIAQITGIGDTREQHLMLIATTQHFLHASHDAGSIIVLLHLRIQRIAHHRAVQQPRRTHRITAHNIHFSLRTQRVNGIQQTAQNRAIPTVPTGMVA